jgi:hypothetical protein
VSPAIEPAHAVRLRNRLNLRERRALGGASALFENCGFRKELLESGLQLCWTVERLAKPPPVFRAELERLRIGDLLLCSDACALQDEIRDVYARCSAPRCFGSRRWLYNRVAQTRSCSVAQNNRSDGDGCLDDRRDLPMLNSHCAWGSFSRRGAHDGANIRRMLACCQDGGVLRAQNTLSAALQHKGCSFSADHVEPQAALGSRFLRCSISFDEEA